MAHKELCMAFSSILGFPRIGAKRELKKALEGYWSGKLDETELDRRAAELRRHNWSMQQEAGLDFIPSNDFSLYDHVLDMSAVLGAIPPRYGWNGGSVDKDTYFAMARGTQGRGESDGVPAMEMTKWFDTNYHYIVPEFSSDTSFELASRKPVIEFQEALELGIETRPVLIGPVSYLLLGKGSDVEPLELLDDVLPVYAELLAELEAAGAKWIQLDEPFLTMELSAEAGDAYRRAYDALSEKLTSVRLLVASYFGELRENAELAFSLPVSAVHVDLESARDARRHDKALEHALAHLGEGQILSVGIVNGRNVWRTDFEGALERLEHVAERLGSERLIVGSSCSLLHSPVDLELETELEVEIRRWLAYAKQKVHEIAVLSQALNEGREAVSDALEENAHAIESRRSSQRVHDEAVEQELSKVDGAMARRNSPFSQRKKIQRLALELPLFPTTTIGSFPQTQEIRRNRSAFRKGRIDESTYRGFLMKEIEQVVRFQERVGLDVLVHGEPERNDMVEYFGEQLEGYVSTKHGWVQSYGSRCVKPPVIFGDVSRPRPMTTDWIKYAQSLTTKPMKGMLTGPVTMLQWSFVRDDQPRSETAKQIALALRKEVRDLESSGIRVIQIDEPALREGLPLRESDWERYLDWAVESFRLASSVVTDQTQIHTHMCYAEFNDIIESIANLDADVISIESSRSKMELLDAFRRFQYPNDIGPGVYDIHSPRIPPAEEMKELLEKGTEVLSADQLWVNPDCGLKTRSWEEIESSLEHMVQAAKLMRERVSAPAMR
jgi:5-methyltetrahydropteroyltriglutamate--homocysteine methyltransferase